MWRAIIGSNVEAEKESKKSVALVDLLAKYSYNGFSA